MKDIRCILGRHEYPTEPQSSSVKPCEDWDDCDVKEHRVERHYFYCKRDCGKVLVWKFKYQRGYIET